MRCFLCGEKPAAKDCKVYMSVLALVTAVALFVIFNT